jgi:hypothetical protein
MRGCRLRPGSDISRYTTYVKIVAVLSLRSGSADSMDYIPVPDRRNPLEIFLASEASCILVLDTCVSDRGMMINNKHGGGSACGQRVGCRTTGGPIIGYRTRGLLALPAPSGGCMRHRLSFSGAVVDNPGMKNNMTQSLVSTGTGSGSQNHHIVSDRMFRFSTNRSAAKSIMGNSFESEIALAAHGSRLDPQQNRDHILMGTIRGVEQGTSRASAFQPSHEGFRG